MEEQIAAIKAKIEALGLQPRATVSLSEIRALEQELDISIPEEYVAFVTQIGDGWDMQLIGSKHIPTMESLFKDLDKEHLRQAFPFEKTWIWEGEEADCQDGETDEEWNERVDKLLEPVDYGNIPLIMGYSGEIYGLIVKGPMRSKIWAFTDVGITPTEPLIEFLPFISAYLDGKDSFI